MTDSKPDTLSQRIRRLMRRRRMTAAELADAAGITSASVYLILNGKKSNPTLQSLRGIASALDVQVGQLVDGTGPEREGD